MSGLPPQDTARNCLHSCCEPACDAGDSGNHGIVEMECVLARFSAGMGSKLINNQPGTSSTGYRGKAAPVSEARQRQHTHMVLRLALLGCQFLKNVLRFPCCCCPR